MKLAALTLSFLTLWFSTSCTTKPGSVTVDPNGTITATGAQKIGGRSMVYAKNDKVTVVVSDNNEDSFREGNKTVRGGIFAWGATSIFSDGAAAYQSVKNTKTAADVSKAGLIENTKVVGLKEATAQKGMELEFEAMKLGAGE